MICPFCSAENIDGADVCDSCEEDLTAFDVIEPKTELERILVENPVSGVPAQKAVLVTPETTAYEAVCQMNQDKVGCIMVMQNDDLVGIVTERDILYKAYAKTIDDLKSVPLATIMTANPETLDSADTVAYALNRMSVGGFRHLPVLKEGRVSHLISVRNILNYITEHLGD